MHHTDHLNELTAELQKQDIIVHQPRSYEELLQALSAFINQLIVHDFDKLILLLYRLDIPENKLKNLLAEKPKNAGNTIALLIIERQLQKIESRSKFRQDSSNIPDDEKW